MDSDCVNNINAVITAENTEFTQTPNHYLRGFAGALIGGLAGGLVAAALYAVGFISSISAFISIILGAFLYGKFGGKQNKMMVVIVSVTTLLFMILSVFVIYLVATAIAVKDVGVPMGTLEAFVYLMRNDPDVARAFWLDVILSVVFTALGIGYQIFILLKKVKRPKELQ